jgi:hypothetical protein
VEAQGAKGLEGEKPIPCAPIAVLSEQVVPMTAVVFMAAT